MWVLKQLTGEHKHNCLTIYQGLLNNYCTERYEFLRLTVTGDKAGTIILQKANTRVVIETSNITSQKEVQNSTRSGKNDFETFLGCTRANIGTL
jgi:hypothetical protein